MNRISWMCYRRRLLVPGLSAMLLSAGAAGCGRQAAPKTADPEMADPYTTDTTYLRRVAYQKEMSYKVPMDSLTRMWVRVADVSPENAPALVRESACELGRVAMQYGSIPADQAYERVDDSLKKARPELYQRAIRNSNRVGGVITTDAICNMIGWKPAAESLSAAPVPESIMRKLRSQTPPP